MISRLVWMAFLSIKFLKPVLMEFKQIIFMPTFCLDSLELNRKVVESTHKTIKASGKRTWLQWTMTLAHKIPMNLPMICRPKAKTKIVSAL